MDADARAIGDHDRQNTLISWCRVRGVPITEFLLAGSVDIRWLTAFSATLSEVPSWVGSIARSSWPRMRLEEAL
jgi:hypothetical protein